MLKVRNVQKNTSVNNDVKEYKKKAHTSLFSDLIKLKKVGKCVSKLSHVNYRCFSHDIEYLYWLLHSFCLCTSPTASFLLHFLHNADLLVSAREDTESHL